MDDFSARGGNQRVSNTSASVDIVIVNWNAGKQLAACIGSIARFGANAISSAVVVDNGSTDGSLDGLDRFGLRVVRNGANQGFARACNQGAAMGSAPYILFLNPDTRLFVNSLSRPLAFMEAEKNSHVGICGIQLVDETGRVSPTCSRFPTLGRLAAQAFGLDKLPGLRSAGMSMAGWGHDTTAPVDQVMGAFFLVRRDLFERLKGFDERFFVYFEEVDFSYRSRLAGWRTVFLAEAQAFHEGGGTSRQVKAKRLFYSLRSRLLYAFKHFSLWQAWTLLIMTLLVEPVMRTIFCLGRGQWGGAKDTLLGYWILVRNLAAIVRKGTNRPTTHLTESAG